MITGKINAITDQMLYRNVAPSFIYGDKWSANIEADNVPEWLVYYPLSIDTHTPGNVDRVFDVLLFFLAKSEMDREPGYYDPICLDMQSKQNLFFAAIEDQKDLSGRRLFEVVGKVKTVYHHQTTFFDIPVTGIDFAFKLKYFTYTVVCNTLPEIPVP